MPSPFPGMNPYLENPAIWPDFHTRIIAVMAEELERSIPQSYYVSVEEYVYIRELPDGERVHLGRPDASLFGPQTSVPSRVTSATLSAPLVGQFWTPVDEQSIPYLEIRNRDDHSVVTALELLSPSNKQPGPDRTSYLRKRRGFLQSRSHFVEIDLLRDGPKMPIGGLPVCDYYVAVSCWGDRPQGGIWPISVRDVLPDVPIPLSGNEEPVPLPLKTCLDRVYDAAGYYKRIYRQPPVPPLSTEDTSWAEAIVISHLSALAS